MLQLPRLLRLRIDRLLGPWGLTVLALGAAVVAVTAFRWQERLDDEVAAANAAVAAAARGAAPGVAAPAETSSGHDATSLEAEDSTADRVGETLAAWGRASSGRPVRLVQVAVSEQPSAAGTPGRVQLRLSLSGPYAETKAAIGALLQAVGPLALQRAQIRATGTVGAPETAWEVALSWPAPDTASR